jgi:hypothetical protein
VGHRYQARLNGSRISSAKLAAILGISTRSNRIGSRDLTASALCYTAQQTVLGYCHSADADITAAHLPQLRGVGIRPAMTSSPISCCPTPLRCGQI